MQGTPKPISVSTKIERIAKLAKEMPKAALRTLAHHIVIEWLHEACRGTRNDGPVGVDGETAAKYAENLDENLRSLLDRAKSQGPATSGGDGARSHLRAGFSRLL